MKSQLFSILGTIIVTAAAASAQWTASTPQPSRERLNGTYRLNESKSDDFRAVARTVSGIREEDRAELEELVKSPPALAIELRGTSVRIAMPGEAPESFIADGKARTNTSFGPDAQVRVSIAGPELTVAVLRNGRDVTTTMQIDRSNNELKVTRRITTEYLSETVFAELYYDRTDAVARFEAPREEETYSSNERRDRSVPERRPSPSANRPGTYIVSNGEIVTATLENDIITGVTQDNDRFRMTVTAPARFRGAVISGYVSGVSRSGRVSGRAEVTFNFETVRLTNGRTYDFAGILMSVTDTEGRTIKTDSEGAAKSDSQTKDTAKRSGIGAGIGAVLGGIVGGGKGAVLGAIIGGGAGAGSVIVQGKDDLKLLKGSSISVQASAPRQ
jgi:hypothetical protein